jgi:hypothetical protein
MVTALIYFIACHGAPAAHFSEFAKELRKEGCRVEILATGPALDKLKGAGAKEFNEDILDINDPASQRLLAEKVAQSLGPGSVVITDLGHLLMASIQEAIAKEHPLIERFAYYENPEPFVPGGYMQTAAKVMASANKVLFANANLAKEPLYLSPSFTILLPLEKRIGVGYYPVEAAKFLESARGARKEIARRQFFEQNKLTDTGQKILVYLGGNNDVYFQEALPAFLMLLRESKLDSAENIVLMQHHPGDKKREIDLKLSGGFPLIVSKTTSEESLLLADAVLYYQSSMAPQFALAGIPAIQVGHDTYPDILIRNNMAPSATTKEKFVEAVKACAKPKTNGKLLADLGISPHWLAHLKSALSVSDHAAR